MEQAHRFVLGVAVGIGTAAAGYYIYKKNQNGIDNFLREHGFNLPTCAEAGYESMSLEELMVNKEHLEDLIAEKELTEKETAKEAPTKKAPAKKKPEEK